MDDGVWTEVLICFSSLVILGARWSHLTPVKQSASS